MRRYMLLCMRLGSISFLVGMALKGVYQDAHFVGWCLGMAFIMAALVCHSVDVLRGN